MAKYPQKKKKQSWGDMCKLLCLNSLGPFLSSKWTTLTVLFLIMIHWIFLKYMAQRFIRLLFDFTGSFVYMISVYSDVNSLKLFPYVSAYFCLPIGGRTQSHQDDGGTPTHGGY